MFEVNQIITLNNNKFLVRDIQKTKIKGKMVNLYICKWFNKTGGFYPGTTFINDKMLAGAN